MKNIVKRLLFTLFVTISMGYATSGFAQDPPPPPNGGHGMGGSQPPGGGAPIGEGLLILTFLAASYGGKKWISNKKVT
jgi:hypothetical protein